MSEQFLTKSNYLRISRSCIINCDMIICLSTKHVIELKENLEFRIHPKYKVDVFKYITSILIKN
jgi:hypothetical protein